MADIVEPVFNFDVPDWDYLAFVVIATNLPFGVVDTLAMIYRDGSIKMKICIKFPSKTKMVASKENFKTMDDALNLLNETSIGSLKEMGVSNYKELINTSVVYNTTTKGQDLFGLITTNPNIDVTYKMIED